MKKVSDEVSLKGKVETITAMDFRRSPGEVLWSVALGKTFIITKAGKPIAQICPIEENAFDLAALQRLRKVSP